MPVLALRPGAALQLHNLYEDVDSLTYTTATLFCTAMVISAVAIIVLIHCKIHASFTKQPLKQKVMQGAVMGLAAMMPTSAFAIYINIELSEKKKELTTLRNSEITQHEGASVDELTSFLAEKILKDSALEKHTWHSTYKTYLIGKLKLEFPSGNVHKALTAIEKADNDKLEKRANRNP